jgi:DNA modification methylase
MKGLSKMMDEVLPFKPYYDRDGITIYNADCRQVLPFLSVADLVLTDPPYGINATKQTLGSGKKKFHRGSWDANVPRNINQVLDAGKMACIWGGNYMTTFLDPTNDWLVWHKNNDGLSFSECELAWTNFGCQVRHLTHHWGGEEKRHPTQKPLAVMRWCFKWADDPKTVVDPFMGAGTTLLAAKLDGRKAIGIELEEQYCEIAAKRLEQGVLF